MDEHTSSNSVLFMQQAHDLMTCSGESAVATSTTSLIDCLRALRSFLSLNAKSSQNQALDAPHFLDGLFATLDEVYGNGPSDDCHLTFRVGVQCIANLTADNDRARTLVYEKFNGLLRKWLEVDDDKCKNILAAVFINLEKGNCLDGCLEDEAFLNQILRCTEGEEFEFGTILLENLIEKGHFVKIYQCLRCDHRRLFTIHLLHAVVDKCIEKKIFFTEEIKFVARTFQKLSDTILKTKAGLVESICSEEVAVLTQLVAEVSYKNVYQNLLQQDKSLVITCLFLLKSLHMALRPGATGMEAVNELVKVLNSKRHKEQSHPIFGFKVNLVKIIGNLAWKNKVVQNLVQETDCLPVLLECTKIDPMNPYITEWAIFAVRNLCEGNPRIQQIIFQMHNEGCADVEILKDFGIELDGINIAPLKTNGNSHTPATRQ